MGTRIKLLVTLLTAMTTLSGSGICFGQTLDCAQFRTELERKKQLLIEYTAALSKLDLKGDRVMVTLLNHKIEELRGEIQESERSRNCLEDPTVTSSRAGVGRVRSDEAAFAGTSCADLRKLLIQLLRKNYSLERRRWSVLSAMSTEEMTEFQETLDSLRNVRALLKAKCLPQPPHNSNNNRKKKQGGPRQHPSPQGDQ